MPRSVQATGATVLSELVVYDDSNAPITGLVNANFTKFLSLNGVNNSQPVTVTEIGNGRYQASYVPNAVGSWYLLVRNATYNPRGWDEEYDVTTDGVLSYNGITSNLLDSPAAIDGYTPRQAAELVGAALAGDVSGVQTRTPSFTSMNKTATRIAATVDANGNRVNVVLTP